MATYEVDPISRIEGHMGVKVETDVSNVVTGSNVHCNLWRGFENFLIDREPNDAITFTQRICGVCPVPHGHTSTHAVESVLGYNENFHTFATSSGDTLGVPENALVIRNLVLGCETMMSNITHFYHLVGPDYIQGPCIPPWTPFFADASYNAALVSTGKGVGAGGTPTTGSVRGAFPYDNGGFSNETWSAVIKQYVKALRMRRLTFEAGALFAGRMPMTACYVAGGVTNSKTTVWDAAQAQFESLMTEVGDFVIKEHLPLVLALGLLYKPYDNVNNDACSGWGAGCGNFLSWGCYPQGDDSLALTGGVMQGTITAGAWAHDVTDKFMTGKADSATATTKVQDNFREHVANSHYAVDEYGIDASGIAYPGDVTRTKPNRADGYSWAKAPRWGGEPHEVGPFARMIMSDYYPSLTGEAFLGNVYGVGVDPAADDDYDYVRVQNTEYSEPVTGLTAVGLNPDWIGADLAVALVRDGLAHVTTKFNLEATGIGNSGDVYRVVNSTSTSGTGNFADPHLIDIETAVTGGLVASTYFDSTSIIQGAVTNWLVSLSGGASAMDRLRGRALECLVLIQEIMGTASVATSGVVSFDSNGWIDDLTDNAATFVYKDVPQYEVSGFGTSEAPRGALAHFVTINGGKIAAYQCVVPTTWNASPKCYAETDGPIEAAINGITLGLNNAAESVLTARDDAEPLRIAHTFDPCIACAVH